MQIHVPPQFAAHANAYADAYVEGARLERARIAAITTAPAALDRPQLAWKVALTTDMTVEAALDFIASLPAEAARSSIPPLAERHAAAGGGAGFCGGAAVWTADKKHPMRAAAAKIAAKRTAHDAPAEASAEKTVSPMQAAAAGVAARRDDA